MIGSRKFKMRKHGTQRGFIIVPVLWLLAMLAALTGVMATYLANSAVAIAVNDDQLRGEAVVSAAVEFAAYRLIDVPPASRPSTGVFSLKLAGAHVTERHESELNRIDLNFASKDMIANLFKVLGAVPRDAEWYADRVLGWRTAPSAEALDAEDALYRAAGLSYAPRGAPFVSVDELWLVPGPARELVARAMEFVTVYSGRREIAALDAQPEVVAALPGMTPAGLDIFMKLRGAVARDEGALQAALGIGKADATVQSGEVVRLTVRVEFDNGRSRTYQVVVLLENAEEPYRILYWRDITDITSTGRRGVPWR